MEKQQPQLSIGIIFRDNIRSIEHCLKALDPLRQAVPCQLLMADTGSVDGSREIAERYADVLIDFPWIDDFSAARNALLDLADGEWFMTVDSDEYLDEDFSELTTFLSTDIPEQFETANITVRNYDNYELEGLYSDFLAKRIIRMSSGLRYYGTIHEALITNPNKQMIVLPRVVLKHDGYVGLNSKEGKAKRERNVSLIREELEQEPDDLRRLLQYIESGSQEQDLLVRMYHAVDLVEKESPGWDLYGASIMRYAVATAHARKLPELERWFALAWEKYPQSYFIRLDVDYIVLTWYFDEEKYEECIPIGKRLLKAYDDFAKGGGKVFAEQSIGTYSMSAPVYRESVREILAKAWLETGEPKRSIRILKEIDCTCNGFNEKMVLKLVNILMELHSRTWLDTTGIVRRCWDNLTEPVPDKKAAEKRRDIFLRVAVSSFNPAYQKELESKEDFCRQTYSAFLPLAECEIGVGAALMETEDPAELEQLLLRVERWGDLPITAFSNALEYIPVFPLPDRPLQMEETDSLAQRLAASTEGIRRLALRAVESGLTGSWQQLNWTRALVLAAVRAWGWEDGDAEKAMELARCFVQLEKAFLPRFYAGEVLEGANVSALPPMHRFGWYCIQAFDALDAGDVPGYARRLREALAVNRGMKPLVEFLTEHTPAIQEVQASPQGVSAELSALAEQVRSMLSALDPDDPTVAQLKASPAYQKVAWMIEDGAPHTFIKLPQ